jgi:membrane protein implicated in regulation of membrane protease activity
MMDEMGDVHMDPRKKYDLLLNVAMVLGFGGFILLVALIVPAWGFDSILTIGAIFVWALIVCLLLYWRYRVAKADEGIQADIKKDAQETSKKIEEKAARRGKKGVLRRGAYGEELWYLKDRKEEGEPPQDGENKPS